MAAMLTILKVTPMPIPARVEEFIGWDSWANAGVGAGVWFCPGEVEEGFDGLIEEGVADIVFGSAVVTDIAVEDAEGTRGVRIAGGIRVIEVAISVGGQSTELITVGMSECAVETID